MKKRIRKCPRCTGDVKVVARTHPNRLVTGVATCQVCGRSWGVGATEIRNGDGVDRINELAKRFTFKWNSSGISNL